MSSSLSILKKKGEKSTSCKVADSVVADEPQIEDGNVNELPINDIDSEENCADSEKNDTDIKKDHSSKKEDDPDVVEDDDTDDEMPQFEADKDLPVETLLGWRFF